MKKILSYGADWLARAAFPIVFALLLADGGAARAGLTVDIHLYHDSWGYYFWFFQNFPA